MKKIISMLLAMTFVFSAFGAVSFAEESGEAAYGKVYYSRSYEGGNYTAGASAYPKSNEIKAMQEKNGNKYVNFKITNYETDKDCFFDFSVSEPGESIVIEMDLKSELGAAFKNFNFMLRDNTGYSPSIFYSNERNICDVNGGKLFEMSEEWNHVAVVVNFAENTADYYVNGDTNRKMQNIEIGDFSVLKLMRFRITSDGQSLDVDNMQIYEATAPCEVPFDFIDENVMEPIRDSDAEAGASILYNRTYNEKDQEPDKGISIYPKTNKIEFVTEGDNTFLKLTSLMTAENNNDCFVDLKAVDPPRFVVFEACYSIDEAGVVGNLINLKDTANKQLAILTLNNKGEVTYTPAGNKIGTLEPGKWLKFAVVIDTQTNATDYYVNDEYIDGGIVMASKENFGALSVIRMYLSKSVDSYGKSLYVDNVKLYEGKEPREVKEGELPPRRSVIPENSDTALSYIKEIGENPVLLNIDAQTIYHHGEKSVLDVGAFIKDGRTLVPVRAVSEAFGLGVEWDEASRTVTVDGKAKIVIDSKDMILPDGSTYTLDVPAEITEGRTMLPLRALCEKILGKAVTWNDRGLIIVSDSVYEGTDDKFLEINNYMVFERPDAAAVDAAFKANSPSHPRLYFNAEGFAKLKANAETNEYVKKWVAGVIKSADNYVSQGTLPKYEIPDGKRLLSQSSVASSIFEACGFAYLMTGDMKYVNHAWKAVQAVGSFPDWNPSHYLDVGEMSYGVAICYDWMYNAWTEEQKRYIEKTLYDYSLTVTDQAYYAQNSYNWWVMVEHNWNPWVNGSITCAALAVYEAYPELCADLISKAVRCQESMLKSFYPDGAWMEGISYWAATAEYIARMIDALEVSLGTDFNLTKAPSMELMGYYAYNACGTTGYSNSYHDTSNMTRTNVSVMFWLAEKFNQPDLAKIRLTQMEHFGFGGGMLDSIWYNTDIQPGEITLPLDAYYRDVELVSMRGAWDSKSAAYVSFHGGDTVVNHHHVDSGNYVIDMLGERFIDDIGSETYSVIEHGTGNRYDYYRVRTEGHNLYVVNPSEDVGQLYKDVFSPVEKFESANRSAYSILDISAAYANVADSARRGYKLGDDRRSVTVRDEFTLKEESEVYWFAHTAADVEILDDTSAKLTINGKSIKAIITSNTGAKLEVMDAVPLSTSKNPTQNANVGIKKLMLHFKKSGDVNIQVKYVPYDSALAAQIPEDIKLDDWTNEAGELRFAPKLDSILVNGEAIEEFNPDTLGYTERLEWDTQSVPAVSASKEGYNVEVTQAADFDDVAKITISYADDPTLSTTYSVSFKITASLTDLDASTSRIQVKEITASENPQPENIDINASDADLTTRWSAQGDGQWLCLDFGEVKELDGYCLAVHSGTTRKTYYSIEISEDGENWSEVVSKSETSGMTDEIEVLRFLNRVKARYLRFVGHGNSVNAWNSVTEFGGIVNK